MIKWQARRCSSDAESESGRSAECITGGVPLYCHAKIRRLFEYWQSVHPAEGLPGRRLFDPLDVPDLLPNLCLLDVAPSDDFIFRLVGTRLDYFYGKSFTGKSFISAYRKNRESQAYRDLCAIVRDHLPRWRRGPASFIENREYVVAERVYLPLATDGVHVDMMLGILVAKFENTEFA